MAAKVFVGEGFSIHLQRKVWFMQRFAINWEIPNHELFKTRMGMKIMEILGYKVFGEAVPGPGIGCWLC
jgi:hypothetical protein